MKAAYLFITFSLPFATVLLPLDWHQGLWLLVYAPFAAIAAIFVWRRPDKELVLWVASTPVAFWMFFNTGIFFYGAVTENLTAALQLVLLSLVLSTPIGFLVGAYSIAGALFLYALFRKNSWLA